MHERCEKVVSLLANLREDALDREECVQQITHELEVSEEVVQDLMQQLTVSEEMNASTAKLNRSPNETPNATLALAGRAGMQNRDVDEFFKTTAADHGPHDRNPGS
jgi:hypothetical protein